MSASTIACLKVQKLVTGDAKEFAELTSARHEDHLVWLLPLELIARRSVSRRPVRRHVRPDARNMLVEDFLIVLVVDEDELGVDGVGEDFIALLGIGLGGRIRKFQSRSNIGKVSD